MGTFVRRFVRLVSASLVIAGLFGRPATATAQGYGSLIPEPIRLCEIGTWFETRLDRRVANEEREAILAAQTTYWNAYRELAEKEFDPLAANEQDAWREPAKLPERSRRIASAARTIEELDRTLFDAIDAAIPEAERPAFASVRLARSILRLEATDRLGLGSEGQSPAIVDEMLMLRHLSPATRQAIRPALVLHEARIESALREVRAATDRFQDRLTTAVIRRVAAGESVTAAYAPARDEVIEALGDWTAPARRLVAAIAACRTEFNRLVEFDLAREFAWSRFGRQDPMGSGIFVDSLMVERHFRLALRATKDEARRAELRTAYAQWAKEDDGFVDRVLLRLSDPKEVQTLLGDTAPLREERDAIGTKAIARIRAMVPDLPMMDDAALHRDIFASGPEPEGEDDPAREGGGLLGSVSADMRFGSREAASRWRINWRPAPLEADAVLAWCPDATEAERATVRQVLTDAEERWKERILDPFEDLVARRGNALGRIYGEAAKAQRGEAPGERPARESFVGFGEESVELFDRIAAFDAALFDEIAAVLGVNAGEAQTRPTSLGVALALARCERALAIWADSEELSGVSWNHEVLPNLPTLLRTSVPIEHRPSVGAAIAADAATWIAMARERRIGRARGDSLRDWAMAEGMLRQSDLQRRQMAGATPEELQKAWDEFAAWRADPVEMTGKGDGWLVYRSQSTHWRERFAALLDSLTATSEGRFTADQRLAVEIEYERMVAPNRFHEIRDPAPFFRRAPQCIADDEPRRAAIESLATDSARDLDRWTLTCLAAMRERAPTFRPGTLLDDSSGRAELRFRLDRCERYTATTWRLIGLLTPDELNRLPALRDYDRLCVLSGTAWWNE